VELYNIALYLPEAGCEQDAGAAEALKKSTVDCPRSTASTELTNICSKNVHVDSLRFTAELLLFENFAPYERVYLNLRILKRAVRKNLPKDTVDCGPSTVDF
jgi:hypothetical protein